MAPTIKQIAEEAGVSHQTVSCILGRKAHLFSASTRQRVMAAAQKLGYRPNASARAMRNGHFNAIAVLLSSEGGGRSTLFTGFFDGAEPAAHQAGLHLIVTALSDRQLTDKAFVPKLLREAIADGLLINYYCKIPAAMEALIARHRIPCIWTNAKRTADCVYPDDFEAARRVTRMLIQRGHRRIGYASATFSFPLDRELDHYSAFDRHAGYRAAMEAAGLPVRELLTPRPFKGAELVAALRDWLAAPDRPSAVVTYCDLEIYAILEAVRTLALRVPEDLALATFCEIPLHDGITPMTTMLIPSRDLGRLAVEMLLQKIADPARVLPPRPVEFGVYEAEGE